VALDWLRGRYRELLSDEERCFIADFAGLPVQSAALVVRMIMRQGDLFRTSKLNYAEIGCPRQAAAPLIERGWLDPHPGVSFPNLCRLLRKAELWSALGLRGAARSVRKAELIPLVGEIAEETGRWMHGGRSTRCDLPCQDRAPVRPSATHVLR